MFKIISSILLIVFAAFRPVTIRCGLRRMDRSMRKIRNRFHIRGMCIGGGVPSSAPESLSASPCHGLIITHRAFDVNTFRNVFIYYFKNILNIFVFDFQNQSGKSSSSSLGSSYPFTPRFLTMRNAIRLPTASTRPPPKKMMC